MPPTFRYMKCKSTSKGMFSSERLVDLVINGLDLQLFISCEDLVMQPGKPTMVRVQLLEPGVVRLPGVVFDTKYPRPVTIKDPSLLHETADSTSA